MPYYPPATPAGVFIKDEGTPLANRETSLNFVGTSVTATETSPGNADITVSVVVPTPATQRAFAYWLS